MWEFSELLAHTFGLPSELALALLDLHGPEDTRVIAQRGELVAGLMLERVGQVWGQRVVPTALISGVAVRLHARRQGLAGHLLRSSLADMREAGMATAVLYASNDAMYRSMGFEHAGLSLTVSAPPAAFARPGQVERLPVVRLKDPLPARRLYHRSMVHQDGALDRGEAGWATIAGEHLESVSEWIALPGPDNELRGYLCYRLTGVGPDRRATITDFVATDADAVATLQAVVSRMGPLVSEVRLNTSPDDLLWWGLTHPLGPPLRAQPWLLRVLDPARAISSWGFSSSISGQLSVRWRDPLFPEDDGDHELVVDRGRGRWQPGGAGTLPLSPRPLAALLTGRANARTLRLSGTGRWSEEQDALLDGIFARRDAWMRDRF